MKVGIMSMQRVANYGSFLQAYGLKHIVESMGHTVEFVDYKIEDSVVKNDEPRRFVQVLQKTRNACKMILPSYRSWRKKQIKANSSFNEFYNVFTAEYFSALGISEERNECPMLDVLIIGSDEVFNCTQKGNLVGYSRQLFGADHRAKKLISYAASFGNTTEAKMAEYGITNEIKALLNKFDSISVRDHNSISIVKRMTDRTPEYNIDPVLLYDFSEVDNIAVDLKDYIIVYAYSERISDEEAKYICQFAKEKNKKLISLGYWQTFCDDYIKANPFEVLAYIKKADYVITDTFHGSVFSIKYQKKFATIVRGSNKQKLTDLLNQFDLSDRRVADLTKLNKILEKKIEVESVQDTLKKKQKKAFQYLEKELSLIDY